MDRRPLADRLGLGDAFPPKPPKAANDATAVKHSPKPPTDSELVEAAKAGRAKSPPAVISQDEIEADKTSKK